MRSTSSCQGSDELFQLREPQDLPDQLCWEDQECRLPASVSILHCHIFSMSSCSKLETISTIGNPSILINLFYSEHSSRIETSVFLELISTCSNLMAINKNSMVMYTPDNITLAIIYFKDFKKLIFGEDKTQDMKNSVSRWRRYPWSSKASWISVPSFLNHQLETRATNAWENSLCYSDSAYPCRSSGRNSLIMANTSN